MGFYCPLYFLFLGSPLTSETVDDNIGYHSCGIGGSFYLYFEVQCPRNGDNEMGHVVQVKSRFLMFRMIFCFAVLLCLVRSLGLVV